DPVLDLGDAARSHALDLRSCLSTPLISNDTLVGVIALYSGEVNAFNDNHRRVLEVAARQICDSLDRVCKFESVTRGDLLASLPNIAQLNQIISAAAHKTSEGCARVALLLVEVLRAKQHDVVAATTLDAASLLPVVQHMRAMLRVTDTLFRSDDNTFVVFLSDTDSQTTEAVSNRLRTSVRDN